MGAAIIVKLDIETSKVVLMRSVHASNELFFAATLLPSTLHDGSAVRVVRTDINAPLASQFLETDPDIGLDVLDKVSDVDRAIGVRQCGGNQDPAWVHFVFRPRRRGTYRKKIETAILADAVLDRECKRAREVR